MRKAITTKGTSMAKDDRSAGKAWQVRPMEAGLHLMDALIQ